MKYIVILLNIMVKFVEWSSVIMAIFACITMLHIKKTKKLNAKDWFLLVLSGLYILTFFGLLIFNRDLHNDVFSVLSMLAIFIACTWTRYEDRRYGTRWWNW